MILLLPKRVKDSLYFYNSNSGCDFVVATTQASINSGLLELLDEET